MLKIDRLSKKIGGFNIRDVSFDVSEGEYFVLLGASGTGKTVLLETVAGIHMPDSGSISLDGRDITRERIQHRGTALIFQDQALFPHMSVRKNVMFGPESMGCSKAETSRRTNGLASRLGVKGLLDRKPETLSGGEAQRVALARALAVEPKCLLLDEPLSSLDTSARIGMRSILREINRKGMTMVHVTHDYEDAVSLASRIGVMENGTIVQTDTPDRIFRYPRSEFVARFIGIRNFFRGTLSPPSSVGGGARDFASGELRISVLSETDCADCFAMIRSEDVTISNIPPDSSARNCIEGTVKDLFPVRMGVEVVIDAGAELAATLTAESAERLGVEIGSRVFASFKASAVRVIEA